MDTINIYRSVREKPLNVGKKDVSTKHPSIQSDSTSVKNSIHHTDADDPRVKPLEEET